MTSRWFRLFIVLCLASVAAPSALAEDPKEFPEGKEFGLELIPWSKKVGEHRYESPRDYDATLKFFRDKFKGWKQIKWSREVSLPTVKYVHIENTGDAKWQGVNIYLLPDGHVRFFVLERLPVAKTKPTSP